MRKIDDPFISMFPSVDLHGLTGMEARIKTNEFINDSLKLGNYDIIIIHGKGTGVVRTSVHEYLKSDRRVIDYKLDNFNDGVTVVKLEGEKYEK